MKLYKTTEGFYAEQNGAYYSLPKQSWDKLINRDKLFAYLTKAINKLEPIGDKKEFSRKTILPPIGQQEVWAAGVTYLRSKSARMEESEGAAQFYDLVYDAERPELFFKATSHRVIGHKGKVRIRRDSTWNVPEPELTLFVNSKGCIQAYTIGNDMSSRSIEGENPLYLPQAKTYDGSAALGPCLLVLETDIDKNAVISLKILRGGIEQFSGMASVGQLKRTLPELVAYLFRELHFPQGVFLMTGTCIVPDGSFTLQSGDDIRIEIDGIGLLQNQVA
jgi:2-dehydro-3-deoxy-D-arabinonate dehydratase